MEEIEKEIHKCSKYEDKVILYKTNHKKRIKQEQPDNDQISLCVTSGPNENSLHRFIEKSKHILASASFDLRKWERASLNIGRDPSDPIPILGLLCHEDEDNILCDTAVLKCSSLHLTRRKIILSIIQKNSNTLGILSPASLIPAYPKKLELENWIGHNPT
ncbi:hypothetical protein NPIL_49051 [Nephila pilipes]|uniref:Uncharacterized protein n=1 Tax=Nephila pilipes TaxID=299642 RepID=A0A8X6MAD8_NEPPI|nr:hypothetical protein NPIL_49051 [Nephila pilipes]